MDATPAFPDRVPSFLYYQAAHLSGIFVVTVLSPLPLYWLARPKFETSSIHFHLPARAFRVSIPPRVPRGVKPSSMILRALLSPLLDWTTHRT